MMVTNQHRRIVSSNARKGGDNATLASEDESRFQVLQEEDTYDIIYSDQIDGMGTDNPVGVSKKKSVAVDVDPFVDVVSLMEGSSTEIIVHKVTSIAGNHKAILIIENDGEDRRVAHSKDGSGNNGKNRVLKENNTKGFKDDLGMKVDDVDGSLPLMVGNEPTMVVGGTIDLVARDGVIGSSKDVSFWYDPWLGGLGPIVDNLKEGACIVHNTATVANMFDEHGQWRQHRIEHLVSFSVLLWIATIKVPHLRGLQDRPSWDPSPTKQIKVSSAYERRAGVFFGLKERIWLTIGRF
ncbi:hypothetical protein V6N12_018826 [Hibiscus sabdariffa]|uniref:Uncharacterized protein n=1 Tax=Hibiscus sabdariffa TaxID=183260 RepID=A0ABR2AV45_9ROSI